MRETFKTIQDSSDDNKSGHTSKLSWSEEANKVEDKEAAESVAEELVGEPTAILVI